MAKEAKKTSPKGDGWGEAERSTSKRLAVGDSIQGIRRQSEPRNGTDKETGEVYQYLVHNIELEDGTLHRLCGAPDLDGRLENVPEGHEVWIERGPDEKKGTGKTARTVGRYEVHHRAVP